MIADGGSERPPLDEGVAEIVETVFADRPFEWVTIIVNL